MLGQTAAGQVLDHPHLAALRLQHPDHRLDGRGVVGGAVVGLVADRDPEGRVVLRGQPGQGDGQLGRPVEGGTSTSTTGGDGTDGRDQSPDQRRDGSVRCPDIRPPLHSPGTGRPLRSGVPLLVPAKPRPGQGRGWWPLISAATARAYARWPRRLGWKLAGSTPGAGEVVKSAPLIQSLRAPQTSCPAKAEATST